MTQDIQYSNLKVKLNEIDHLYGDNIHLIKDPYLLTLVEKIGHPNTIQPLFTQYIQKSYQGLLQNIINNCFERKNITAPTRMKEFHAEGIYQGEIIDVDQKIVCVDLARAGMIPSQLFYEQLNYIMNPQLVRQDHFYAARIVDEQNEVTGVDISGSKIGGDIDHSIVLLPDPMGATGGTICEAINHYKENVPGKAKKFITAHLIITPEYIKNIKRTHPEVEVYAVRLDRGLSTDKALKSIPGQYPNEERGLNDNQYIVPGAGGLGELLNNSFV